MRDDEKEQFGEEVRELVRLSVRALKKYLAEPAPGGTIYLTIGGVSMTIINPDFQLNAGDSVEVAITFVDSNGDVVTPDAGSVTAVLSSTSDSVVLDPSESFATITAGDTDVTGNSITVEGSVSGVAYVAGVGFYDVVADVAPPAPGTIELAFGTETAPAAAPADSAELETPAGAKTFKFNQVTGNYEEVA